MERPPPFQPPDPRSPSGWTLSLGLHGLLLLGGLWYATTRPAILARPPVMPVEVVASLPAPQPATMPAPRAGAASPRARSPQPTPQQVETPPQDDALASKLQALSRLRAPDGPLAMGTGGGAGTGNGGATLADFIRAQIMRRWFPILTNRQRRDAPVLLRIAVNDKGEFTEVTILDRQEFDGNLLYRSMAISARNAAVLSSPIPMPPGNWPKTTVLTISLNPRDASR